MFSEISSESAEAVQDPFLARKYTDGTLPKYLDGTLPKYLDGTLPKYRPSTPLTRPTRESINASNPKTFSQNNIFGGNTVSPMSGDPPGRNDYQCVFPGLGTNAVSPGEKGSAANLVRIRKQQSSGGLSIDRLSNSSESVDRHTVADISQFSRSVYIKGNGHSAQILFFKLFASVVVYL